MSGNSSCVHGVRSTKYSNVQRAWRINRKFRMPRAKIEKDLYLKREFEFPSVDIIVQLSFPLRSINIETSEKRYWKRELSSSFSIHGSNIAFSKIIVGWSCVVKLISTPTIFLSYVFLEGDLSLIPRRCISNLRWSGGNLLVAVLFERTSKRRENGKE